MEDKRKKRQEEIRRTLRRSRRQAAQRKRKERVGEVLGLTPIRTETANVSEAVAEQLAEAAAKRHDRQSDVHQRMKDKRCTGKKGVSKGAPKIKRGSKSKTGTLGKTRRKETGAASAALKGKHGLVISPPVYKAGGSNRLSFWRKDHKVTPRKSLEALFNTSESDTVSEESSTPIQTSEEEEPNTQDKLFVKPNDETTSDGEYEPTRESLEFSGSEEEEKERNAHDTPKWSEERQRAMQKDPYLTPAYFESKDNEGEQRRAGDKVPVARQRTPDFEPVYKKGETHYDKRVDPEEVVSAEGERKPTRRKYRGIPKVQKGNEDDLDDMPPLEGSDTESEQDDSNRDDHTGEDEGESQDKPEEWSEPTGGM